MTHNPLHRIAKLRRELEAYNRSVPFVARLFCENRTVGEFSQSIEWTALDLVFVNHRLTMHQRHTTEEHALKSAVRIARQKVEKMNRGV
jgi:hypothetical protein